MCAMLSLYPDDAEAALVSGRCEAVFLSVQGGDVLVANDRARGRTSVLRAAPMTEETLATMELV